MSDAEDESADEGPPDPDGGESAYPDGAESAYPDGGEPVDRDKTGSAAGVEDGPADQGDGGSVGQDGSEDVEELRRAVEEKYDFENFGPAEMADMSIDEWQAAFDPETWITGEELVDRIEADLKNRIADRDVFARVERYRDPPRLLAYSESSYAMVYPDGSIEGEGTVLRDVKPTVALCSMESYDVPEAPDGQLLPEPGEVPERNSELGNHVLQIIAGVQLLAGVVLFGAGVFQFGTRGANALLLLFAGLGFFGIGIVLFVVVANARLSDSFRAEEYRERLRSVGLEDGERPEFLPPAPAQEDGTTDDGELRSERP